MNLPNELLYSEEHEWVRREGAQVKIGITDFAQSQLGDIVFVQLPKVGDTIKVSEVFGTVESVKTASDLYAPITGAVVAVNQDLEKNPEHIGESPYEAWMLTVEPADAAEFDALLSSEAYQAHISE
ncbi:glycine cleavage system protein GcvH [Candidimonas nitroreducens]|uniref:Glycine cleavage system H protein n=1 Tax=Candidimonas nitroreducens TaxID=683354 RepID=A0A225MLB3_9BURK|nr:glycine cleavage system protein GcvH [Candidimonas nitroreducens]OWT61955.1 glycine cleavage system protein H [Candidimonas nitroreducens]